MKELLSNHSTASLKSCTQDLLSGFELFHRAECLTTRTPDGTTLPHRIMLFSRDDEQPMIIIGKQSLEVYNPSSGRLKIYVYAHLSDEDLCFILALIAHARYHFGHLNKEKDRILSLTQNLLSDVFQNLFSRTPMTNFFFG